MGKKELIDYNMETVTSDTYNLKLQMTVQNRLVKYIFEKSKTKLKRKKGIGVSGSVDEIKSFKIPAEGHYFKLLKTALNKQVRDIAKIFHEDGIYIVNHEVLDAYFIKDVEKDVWRVHIKLEGYYNDKRKQQE